MIETRAPYGIGQRVRFHPIIGMHHDGNLYTIVMINHTQGYCSLKEKGDLAVDLRAISPVTAERETSKTCPRCGSPCHKMTTDHDGHWKWVCGTCSWDEYSGGVLIELLGCVALLVLLYFLYWIL